MPLDLTALAVTLIVALFIPFLVELMVKINAPMSVRSVVNLLLSVLAGVVPTITISDYDNWKAYLVAILSAWLVAARVHYTGAAEPAARIAPNVGVGGTTTHHDPNARA